MKKILFIIIISLMFVPFGAKASGHTWQKFNNGVLTVYSGSSEKTSIIYRGGPSLYNKNRISNIVDQSINVYSTPYKNTWQTYSRDILTVHTDANKKSKVTYRGTPKKYLNKAEYFK